MDIHKIGTSELVQVVQVKDTASQAVFAAKKIKQLVAKNPDMGFHDIAVAVRGFPCSGSERSRSFSGILRTIKKKHDTI